MDGPDNGELPIIDPTPEGQKAQPAITPPEVHRSINNGISTQTSGGEINMRYFFERPEGLTELEKEFGEKTIVVTGAGSGIGRALMEKLHGLGARVVAIDRDMDNLQAAISRLSEQKGSPDGKETAPTSGSAAKVTWDEARGFLDVHTGVAESQEGEENLGASGHNADLKGSEYELHQYQQVPGGSKELKDVIPWALDVTDYKTVREKLLALDRIDGLAACAAIVGDPLDPSDKDSQPSVLDVMNSVHDEGAFYRLLDDYRRVMEVNLIAPRQMAMICAEKMRSRSKDLGYSDGRVPNDSDFHAGSIVFVGSTNPDTGKVDRVNGYNDAKFGLDSLMNTAAGDWSEMAIRVNEVAPGATDTPMVSDPVRAAAKMPLGINSPPDVANAIIYFLSDTLSGQVTGQKLKVDGGKLTATYRK